MCKLLQGITNWHPARAKSITEVRLHEMCAGSNRAANDLVAQLSRNLMAQTESDHLTYMLQIVAIAVTQCSFSHQRIQARIPRTPKPGFTVNCNFQGVTITNTQLLVFC